MTKSLIVMWNRSILLSYIIFLCGHFHHTTLAQIFVNFYYRITEKEIKARLREVQENSTLVMAAAIDAIRAAAASPSPTAGKVAVRKIFSLGTFLV